MSVSSALAFELSQRIASIAVRRHDGTVLTTALPEGRDAAEGVLLEVDRLMRRLEMRPSDLEMVAVSIGPGGFTGIRISIAAAQSIAHAAGATAVGVPSALVAVESSLGDDSAASALSLLAVKRRDDCCDAWVTKAIRRGGVWSIDGEPGLQRSDAWAGSTVDVVVAERTLVANDVDHLPAATRWVAPRFEATACLAIADRLRGDRSDDRWPMDPADLGALYPRRPEAVSLFDARDRARRDA